MVHFLAIAALVGIGTSLFLDWRLVLAATLVVGFVGSAASFMNGSELGFILQIALGPIALILGYIATAAVAEVWRVRRGLYRRSWDT